MIKILHSNIQKKLIHILPFLFIFFLSLNVLGQNSKKKEALDCVKVLENLKTKNTNLTESLKSIGSLLGSKTIATVPLTILFQIDIKDEKEISKRISELAKLTTEKEILQQSDFKTFLSCAKEQSNSELLDESVKKQALLNAKRLSFLKLDSSFRENLISTFDSSRRQFTDKQYIEQQLLESQHSLESAQTNLIKNEQNVSSQDNEIKENFLSAQTLLEKFIVDIETEHIEFIEKIKKERQSLENLRSELSLHMKSNLSASEIASEFSSVDKIWHLASENLLETFTKINISSKFSLPDLLASPTNSEQEKRYIDYSTIYQKAKQRLTDLSDQKHNLLLDIKALNFRLVSDSGKLRADLINRCRVLDSCDEIRSISQKSITGIITELRILPLKFLAGGFNKVVEFRSKVDRGFDGWTDVIRQILIFFLLVILPFLVHKILSELSLRLNQFREKILSRSILDYRRRTHMGLWISRLNPFVPSMGMVLSIHLARALIEATDLQELSYLLFYLEVYFIYRATRLLLQISMEFLFSSGSLSMIRYMNDKAEKSARRLSRFFFGRYVLLHIVEDTVRQGLVYGI
ncbi:MAG: hypothetical protein KDD45_02265, partial [Bdellovibrionales bacterium]|nr:hypothetical protein [Bdellovibrionales bacterium]